MSTFNLGLPVDIPWQRVCVSDDMNNYAECGVTTIAQWRSSLAIYSYEPPDQIITPLLQGAIVTYVKVSATLTPYSPNMQAPSTTMGNYLTGPSAQWFPNTYPCYGALLQVTVKPATPGIWPPNKWPYFSDFEPKSRELYESVSETGEALTGSASALSVGKSASTTHSLEAKVGLNLPVPALPLSLSATDTTTHTDSSSQQSDSSTERRETQSHSTQLSQMYHLFQGFHTGTNRAMFLMEPRPHIKSTQTTFLNGPRELEGIQDVFLVVIKPNTPYPAPLCFDVQLDTAHLYTDLQNLNADFVSEFAIGKTPSPGSLTKDYTPPNSTAVSVFLKFGQVLDQPNTQGVRKYEAPLGFKIFDYHAGSQSESYSFDITATDTEITVTMKPVTSFPDGSDRPNIGVELHVNLVPASNTANEALIKGMFLIGRKLCCCSEVPNPNPSVTFSRNLQPEIGIMPTGPGPMTTVNILNSRIVSSAIKKSMIESTTSGTTVPVGQIPFDQSDVYYQQLVNLSKLGTSELSKTANVSNLLTPPQRDVLQAYLGNITLDKLVATDAALISNMTGMTQAATLQLKDQILRGAKPAPLPPPIVNPLRKVIAVRLLSTYPNPVYPKILYDFSNPQQMPSLNSEDQANVVEVDFSGAPDPGTVTATSFQVTQGGSILPATIVQMTISRFRLLLTTPLITGGVFGIILKGTGGSAITFGGVALDGDPIAFPSGDNIAGGDFTAAISIVTRIPAPPLPPPMPTLLKIIAARIKTDIGTPSTLYEMLSPGTVPTLTVSSNVDIIEVNLSGAPDAGTVTTTTFSIVGPTGPVAGSIITVNPTTYQFKTTSAISSAGVYSVLLKGAGTPAITITGIPLDGDPIALPSGDGVPGGNFMFSFQTTL